MHLQTLHLRLTAPLFLGGILFSSQSLAQSPQPASSRAEKWRKMRVEKSTHLRSPTRTGLENTLRRIEVGNYLYRLQTGFHGLVPVFGGFESGSGFAAGALYSKNQMARGMLDFQATARASAKLYQQYGLRLSAPRLANRKVFLDLRAEQRNHSQDNFFGLGPDSSRANRSNFRDERFDLTGTFGVRPTKWLSFGTRGGLLRTNVGRGTGEDDDAPPTDDVFDPGEVPGLVRQPHYGHVGAFLEVNYLDAPNPRSGGQYLFRWTNYDDHRTDQFGFRRYEVDLYQYVPFFNKRRVIVARASTSLTDTSSGQQVPFFMMRTIGGSTTLRGFREYRFRDRNFLLFNLEYRWEVFSGLDMALFSDAGKVFANSNQLTLEDLEAAYGIGFRFNTAQGVFLRLDVGHGREGTRLFVKFGHVF